MAKYFNKTRSPFSAPLRDGSTAYFAPKKWVVVTKDQEGTAALVQLVKKGLLVRREVAAVAAPAPAPVPVVAPTPKVEPTKPPPPPPAVVEIPPPEPETDVHVDVTIEAEESFSDDDPTSLSAEVDENTVASEDEIDTESKATRRTKPRRRG